MFQKIRKIALSRFREEVGDLALDVAQTGMHLHLTRWGKPVAAVVPMYQAEMLGALLGEGTSVGRAEWNAAAERHREARAIQNGAEMTRLEQGRGIGNPEREDHLIETLARGHDPWREDQVLIVSGRSKR